MFPWQLMHTFGIALFILYYSCRCDFLSISTMNSRRGIRSEFFLLFPWNSSWYLVVLLQYAIIRHISVSIHTFNKYCLFMQQPDTSHSLTLCIALFAQDTIIHSLYVQNAYSFWNAQLKVTSSGKTSLNVKERGYRFLLCALAALTSLNCECLKCIFPPPDWELLEAHVLFNFESQALAWYTEQKRKKEGKEGGKKEGRKTGREGGRTGRREGGREEEGETEGLKERMREWKKAWYQQSSVLFS